MVREEFAHLQLDTRVQLSGFSPGNDAIHWLQHRCLKDYYFQLLSGTSFERVSDHSPEGIALDNRFWKEARAGSRPLLLR